MKMPWWLRGTLIFLDILIIIITGYYYKLYINKNTYDFFTFQFIELGMFIIMNIFLLITLVFVICTILKKYKNYILIIISSILVIIYFLFIYFGKEFWLEEEFEYHLINIKLKEKFNENYTIIKKEKIDNDYVYDVVLNNNKDLVLKVKKEMPVCTSTINCSYIVVSNYKTDYFKYYLDKYNKDNNKDLNFTIKGEKMMDLGWGVDLEYSCSNMHDCFEKSDSLIDFRKYLNSNGYSTENIIIHFVDNNKKNIYNEKYNMIEK